MIDAASLTSGLQRLLLDTEKNILEQVEADSEALGRLRARHDAAVAAGRATASDWLTFRNETMTQAGAHWLLSCVFVRFLEDNDLIPDVWIAGPGERLTAALDRRALWYTQNRLGNDTDYLLDAFRYVAGLPGMAGLFDARHNPVWSLRPSGPHAMKILQFFQNRDADREGQLRHDFTDPDWNTRFLGDLYQSLSESARKRYALLQTPDFVVQFILSRTLKPAVDVFGNQLRLIDPACGSGHFLIAAFSYLFEQRASTNPEEDTRTTARAALGCIYGVDLNPFAVAIARFRLMVAALRVSGISNLLSAPDFLFNLAVGDSLIHGRLLGREVAVQYPMGHDPRSHFFDSEDREVLDAILGQQYHVVVGNPPYITVSDAALRATYRQRFRSCHGTYQLTVPFLERFFNLALSPTLNSMSAGLVGLIVSNAFAKRSFGRLLVTEYLSRITLTHVIDASGTYLPGHGTPTVIILGTSKKPSAGHKVRAVRGIRGEISVPPEPANAKVWTSIVSQVDIPGSTSDWVSVADVDREVFSRWPWALGGGGAAELRETVQESAEQTLENLNARVGGAVRIAEEDAFVCNAPRKRYLALPTRETKKFLMGDECRDWISHSESYVLFPYSGTAVSSVFRQVLWPWRKILAERRTFQGNMADAEREWWEYQQYTAATYRTELSIAFAEIATHNHFVLDRGGKVFKQTAPVIKLPPDSSEEQHLGILGLLNSSTGCFWLKQVCFPKGGDTVGQDGARVRKVLWDVYYAFDGTKLKQFPLPSGRPLVLAQAIQERADRRAAILPDRVVERETPSAEALNEYARAAEELLSQMIALQEELDWHVYHLYGLLDEDLSLAPQDIPPLRLGERAFEIRMAREMAAGELETTWFERHGSTPITELPSHWPAAYRRAVERRLEILRANRDIALIEQPEYKRRWNLPSWGEMQKAALEKWLLDRMESAGLWASAELQSCSRLADRLRPDAEFMRVAAILAGAPDFDITSLVKRLALKQALPFLPVLRYKASGLEKRRIWEQTWELQRREDAGETVEIPVPPKYRSADFLDNVYWNLRGSLDVPKERFILYPGLERDADATPVLGWAGWDHLQQARALAAYYHHVKDEEGWTAERLQPVLAGIADLLPWLRQWHNEPDPETGEPIAAAFATYVETECQELGITVESLREWAPRAGAARGGRRR